MRASAAAQHSGTWTVVGIHGWEGGAPPPGGLAGVGLAALPLGFGVLQPALFLGVVVLSTTALLGLLAVASALPLGVPALPLALGVLALLAAGVVGHIGEGTPPCV